MNTRIIVAYDIRHGVDAIDAFVPNDSKAFSKTRVIETTSTQLRILHIPISASVLTNRSRLLNLKHSSGL
jgi:hypothetical protein